MNSSPPEISVTDHEPNRPPSPVPNAENGEDLDFQATNQEAESDDKKDKEMDEESFSYSSSYSNSDSESDFFQINPPELAYPQPTPTTSSEINAEGIEKICSPRNREKPSGLGIERRSPVIQSMVRDPNRIPSSIFARSPMTPMEWSVASNESLFSIHMGNSSFTRDQMFLTGRSGDLRGFASGTMDYPSPWISQDSRLPAAAAAGGVERKEMGDLVTEIDEAAAASANAEAMREVMRAAAEGKESEKKLMLGRSISRHSDGSATSFAFPILTGDGRVGSIKVNFEPLKDHQVNSQGKRSKLFAGKGSTARMSSHRSAQSRASASPHSHWFPCFFTCKFCCCCEYH
ncbi:uncharacterized protein LOC110096447 [Dendrobium catenatum]|uniref:uncharacterized protein LOC110096447 n=1 Tax=Dendrobium catenatum TaxID=906689 RepID=UPI0009F1C35A|nr:uncharacterized protein LOC110096447 [Dendrobium catenatum]